MLLPIPGYFCPEDEKIFEKEPANFECPVGHKCPTMSASPTPCPLGTYTDTKKQSECAQCPPGKQCLDAAGTSSPAPCKAHHYCPGGDVVQPKPCEDGTYTGWCVSGSVTCILSAAYTYLC